MNCPKCSVTLSISERQGVEIDYCPQCRGVWLDRGELDKLIERASVASPPPTRHHDTPTWHHDDDDDWDDRRGPKRKRKSLLGEIFDF
jgi:Zn-finger nucleic acid-binding protein